MTRDEFQAAWSSASPAARADDFVSWMRSETLTPHTVPVEVTLSDTLSSDEPLHFESLSSAGPAPLLRVAVWRGLFALSTPDAALAVGDEIIVTSTSSRDELERAREEREATEGIWEEILRKLEDEGEAPEEDEENHDLSYGQAIAMIDFLIAVWAKDDAVS